MLLKHLFKNLIFIILGSIAAYYLFKYVVPLLAPFILAGILSLIIEPMVVFLQNKGRIPRALAVGTSMLVFIGGLGLIISVGVTRLIAELLHLSTSLPNYITNIKTVALSLQNRAELYYFALPPDVLDFINTRIAESNYSLDSLLDRSRMIIGDLLNYLLQLVASVPAWIILFIISGIATYFIAKDRRELIVVWLKVIPSPWGKKILCITSEVLRAMFGYARAQAFLISFTLIQSIIGLYIIDAPYALLMGLTIGVADLIPIIGPGLIYVPWAAWGFVTGDTAFAIKLIILYAIIMVVRQVLETKIVSHSMGLHPLATLVAMYVGLQILGPIGVIAGPLSLIVLKAFASAGLIGWEENR